MPCVGMTRNIKVKNKIIKMSSKVAALYLLCMVYECLGGGGNNGRDNSGIVVQQYGLNPKVIVKTTRQEMENVPNKIYLSADEVIEDFHKTIFGKRLRKLMLTYQLVKPTLCQLYKSPFGCCWDNKTIAFGVNGEGCPKCVDQKHSCSKWTDFCHIAEIKQVCPQSCNACPTKRIICENSTEKDNDSYCRLYVKFGLCKHERINTYCSESCNGCN